MRVSISVLGLLTVSHPVMLWGIAAVAAPVLIHLLLRPRPHRQPFPALRLILQGHRVAERAGRLRRLLLLLMRMLAIIVLATLLAGPRLKTAPWIPASAGPASVVVCIDDSASMSYRYEGTSRHALAKQWARALVTDRTRFGDESEFAVLTLGEETGLSMIEAPPTFASRGAAVRRIASLPPNAHDRPVGLLLRRADTLLAQARHARREIILFTDNTFRAWRDVGDPPFTATSGAHIACLDVGVDEDRNMFLTLTACPTRAVPAHTPLHIDVAVTAGKDCVAPLETSLEVHVDGEPRLRTTLTAAASSQPATSIAPHPNQTTEATILLGGLPEGLHRISMTALPADPLPWDNTRYLAVQAGELPRVAIVAGPTANGPAAGAPNSALIEAMLAPAGLSEPYRRVDVVHIEAAKADAQDWSHMHCVLLVDVPSLTSRTWRTLTSYVQQGGTIMAILGGAVQPDGYADGKDLLPAIPRRMQEFNPPNRLLPTHATHALLAGLMGPDVDSVSDRAIFRSWDLTALHEDAAVVCTLGSGEPALIERPSGTGQAYVLTFTPDRQWSEFGARAAPMVVLLHTLVETSLPATGRIATTIVGVPTTLTIPHHAGPVVEITAENLPDAHPERINVAASEYRISIPANEPGHVRVSIPGHASEPLYRCAVNVAAEESDLRRTDKSDISSRFSDTRVAVAPNLAELVQTQGHRAAGLDLTIPTGVLLLSLLIAESCFSNRFYRKPSGQAGNE
ncbi:MAG: BatA domain-containing protein [Phycisphaerae bacterium]|nr:BatA domain-containing protein [Phycisphaerae bacterium]